MFNAIDFLKQRKGMKQLHNKSYHIDYRYINKYINFYSTINIFMCKVNLD